MKLKQIKEWIVSKLVEAAGWLILAAIVAGVLVVIVVEFMARWRLAFGTFK